ncbi:MAG: hypothetical protein HZC28_14250 [Spirochaetes bacterium]|nr:hypothetical protein [Spirochaetota bacterium]
MPAFALLFLIGCTQPAALRTEAPAAAAITDGFVDDNTFRASGIGYPNPFDSSAAARNTSASNAAVLIARSQTETELMRYTPRTNDALNTAVKEFIEKKYAVIRAAHSDNGRCDIVIELVFPGLKHIVEQGKIEALRWR